MKKRYLIPMAMAAAVATAQAATINQPNVELLLEFAQAGCFDVPPNTVEFRNNNRNVPDCYLNSVGGTGNVADYKTYRWNDQLCFVMADYTPCEAYLIDLKLKSNAIRGTSDNVNY